MALLARLVFFYLVMMAPCQLTIAKEPIVLTERMHHLRIDGPREWASFAEKAESDALTFDFSLPQSNSEEWVLALTQEDVKQRWAVQLNGTALGSLPIDENPMKVYFAIEAGKLVKGDNRLSIFQQAKTTTDDVQIGRIRIEPQSQEDALNQASVRINVRDEKSNAPSPSRITILNANGSLQTIGGESNQHLAIRPGIVYTSNGVAEFGIPPGTYTIFAGRGFEYSLDEKTLSIAAGESKVVDLKIERQVETRGYVACDTHVHTLTHSGHGDSTVEERMVTLVGEGIELPIATDHNVHIDHQPFAVEANVRDYFTPVIGNEVTTPTGHFNIFPIASGARVPNHRSKNWSDTFREIYSTPSAKITILNHGRDVHSGITPLGPKLFNSASGEFQSGWKLEANAMEVVNSSATQTDAMQLFHDWMTLLNRGHQITPVGSSDSHDVGRHFVGQGRTYIRCDDSDPSQIDVDQAVRSFLQGEVVVSYGLFVEMTVAHKFQSGQVATNLPEQVSIKLRVTAPHWIEADRISLFSNGVEIRSESISLNSPSESAQIEWNTEWIIDRPNHDAHLVAIATGPGLDGLHWKTAKPYQPKSSEWKASVIGCSGAVWLDADGDSKATNAREYASRVFQDSADPDKLIPALEGFDQAVAIQAAALFRRAGGDFDDATFQKALEKGTSATRNGFRRYIRAWRDTVIANVDG